jgi:hypothetical protein
MGEATTRSEQAQEPVPEGAPGRFGAVALAGLCALGPPGHGRSTLALELGLSAWMRMAGVGLGEARAGLATLRGAILGAAGLDVATEPVPFAGRDPRADTLTLAAYLGDLLARAARVNGTDPATIAARAARRLSD